MEQVSTGEFRKRLPFWIKNLPIQLTSNGKVIAEIHPPQTEQAAEEPTSPTPDQKQQKIDKLRAAIQSIETKASPAELHGVEEAEEKRLYTEPTDAGEISVVVTLAGLVKKHGRRNAAIFWKQSKPIPPAGS